MRQQIIQNGDQQVVILSEEALEQLDLKPGDWVEVEVCDSRIVIQPLPPGPRLSRKDRELVNRLYKKIEAVFKALAEGEPPTKPTGAA